ncbi:hypothetical protein [Alkalibacterium olivapovliticus]|uniref:Uncharacterized protein n=1 Tax=Alkalibacterium olivapovliticus TaxID=99907 RepID=A0A2T0VTT4_9LACT|nr:hypothetical protein [Alkalibacterium olivapovliticus]PRY74759.1 hypothetical protein CLV38_13915 [Alkalibacterium olivapovliticus]
MDNQVYGQLISRTAEVMIRNTTEIIFNRIDKAKTSRDDKQTILELEEIVSDLLNDKNQLNSIIHQYEEMLAIQKISDNDIEFITENVVPILSEVLESDVVSKGNEEQAKSMSEGLEILTPLLSTETFKILQLLGFNFRDAFGVPLTNVVKQAINKTNTEELQYENNIAVNNANAELFKLLQTEEGREAFRTFKNQ